MAKKNLSEDEIQLRIIVDGTPARKELAETQQAMQKLRQEQAKLRADEASIRAQRDQHRKGSEEYRGYQEEVVLVQKKLAELDQAIAKNNVSQRAQKEAIGLTGLSMGELRQKSISLKKSLEANAAALGTPLYAALEKELVEVDARMNEIRSTAAREMRQWEQTRKELTLQTMSVKELGLEEKRLQAILADSATNQEDRIATARSLAQVKDQYDKLTNSARLAQQVWEKDRQGIALVDMTLEQLELELKRYQQLQRSAQPNTAQYTEATAGIAAVKDQTEKLTNANRIAAEAWEQQRQSIALADMSLEQLELELKRYQQLQRTAKPDTVQYAEATAGIAAVKDQTELLTNANRQAAAAWEVQRNNIALVDMTLEQLQLEMKRYEAIQEKAMPGSAQFLEAEAGMKAVKLRTDELTNSANLQAAAWDRDRRSIALVDMTMEQLELESARLRTALNKAKPNSAEWAAYRKELDGVEKRQNTLARNGGGFTGWLQNLKKEMKGLAGLAIGLFAGNVVYTGIQNWISGLGKTSDKIADMGKALDLSEENAKRLDKTLGDINTRTTRNDLRDIAIGLGQSGIEASAEAVQSIDRINVALGDAFGEGMAREIATTMTVVRNNLNDIKSADYGSDVGKIANAFNVLEAKGLATGPVLADITNRVAGVARTFDIESASILGTAASFQELGINQERGSTAYIKILQRMAAEPAKFAKVVKEAGLDAEKFASDLNNDMQAAFLTVAKATRIAGAENTSYAAILKDLDTDGAGVSELLSKIGANQQLVADKTALAAGALKNQDSITAEFNKKNNTLQANLEKIGKSLATLFVNPSVGSGLNNLIRGFARLVSPNIVDGLRNEQVELRRLQSQILATNEGTEARVKLVKELQDLYPALLGHLNADTLNNQELATAVKAVNDQLINRIILAEQQEKIDETNIRTAEHRKEVIEREDDVLKKLAATAADYGVEIQAGATVLEQAQRTYDLIYQQQQKQLNGRSAGGVLFNDVARLGNAIHQLSVVSAQENEQTEAGNQLLDERQKLMQRLGIADSTAFVTGAAQDYVGELQRVNAELNLLQRSLRGAEPEETLIIQSEIEKLLQRKEFLDGVIAEQAAKVGSENPAATLTGEENKKEEKFREHLDKLQEDYATFRASLSVNRVSEDEKELQQLRVKHAKEVADVKKNQAELIAAKKLTKPQAEADLAGLATQQETEEITLIEKQGEARLAAYKAADDKITAALADGASQHLQARVQEIDNEIELARGRGESTVALERERRDRLLLLYEDNARNAVDAEVKKWDDLIAILEKQKAAYDAILNSDTVPDTESEFLARKTIADRILQLKQAKADAELAIHSATLQQQQLLDQQYTKALNDQQRLRLENQVQMYQGFGQALSGLDQLLQQFHQNENERGFADTAAAKLIGLAQIAINAATAISGAVAASTAGDPYTFAARVAAALVTVAGGIAQAYSMFDQSDTGSTPPATTAPLQPQLIQMPSGGGGGLIDRDRFTPGNTYEAGVLKGPSHAEDGLAVINPKTGKQVAEFEGGEAYMLFSKKFTEANKDQLGKLLAASRTGSRLNFLDRPLPAPNPVAVRQAVTPTYAVGGLFGPGVEPAGTSGSHVHGIAMVNATAPGGGNTTRFQKGNGLAAPGGGELTRFQKGNGLTAGGGSGNEEIIALLQRLVLAQENPRPAKAVLSLNPEYDRTLENWDSLKEDTRITPARR